LAYQKLLFRGLELYADRDYAEALTMFKKSIDGQIEAAIARATFWKAETEYVLDDYKNALLSFKQFSGLSRASSAPEYKTSITISPTLISNSRNTIKRLLTFKTKLKL
jgi:TolA-binding protein